ncbi:hypothetical protein HOD29_02740 [archaeon]|jgi:hypothetical protein|nr:hypothetical protein [archaeon]
MKKILGGCSFMTILIIGLVVAFFVFIFSGGCAKDLVLEAPIEVTLSSGETTIEMQEIVAEPWGLFNKDEKYLEGIEYKVSVGNVIWGAILVGTVGVPIYLGGWKIMEPVGLAKEKPTIKLPKD